MRVRVISWAAVALLLAAGSLVVWAGTEGRGERMGGMKAMKGMHEGAQGGATTVRGELVDLTCFLEHGGRGATHHLCAVDCVRKGYPLGIATEGGRALLLLPDHRNEGAYDHAKELVAETVVVKGKEVEKEGISGMVVGSVEPSR